MAGYSPPPLGPYGYHEVLSALRKTIKLNRPEDAIYWLNVLLTYGGASASKTAAKQLWIMAAEDCDDEAVTLRAAAVFQMISVVGETDQLYYLVAQMCEAQKWWQTARGRMVDRLWSKAIGDLKVPERNKEVPSYALDRHTRRGWAVFRRTGEFDDRYSGTGLGRAKTEFLFLRDGRDDPDAPFDPKDPAFLKAWSERRALEMPSAGDLEPNDPLGPAGTIPPDGMLVDVPPTEPPKRRRGRPDVDAPPCEEDPDE